MTTYSDKRVAKTEVVNIKSLPECGDDSIENPDYVFIGRPSKWGNPFKIGKDGTREHVVQRYEGWLMQNKKLVSEISELQGKVLGCFCKPKLCHGDILARLANQKAGITENAGKRLPGTVWGVPSDGPNWGRVQGNSQERQKDCPNHFPQIYL